MNSLHFKAILFDGEHRNHEIMLEGMISHNQLGVNYTYTELNEEFKGSDDDLMVINGDESAAFMSRARKIRSLRVTNVTVDVVLKQNLYMTERDKVRLNLTLSDCTFTQAAGRSIDDCIALTYEPFETELNFWKSSSEITIVMNVKQLDVYMEKIANYAFAATMCIMISFFVMLG